MAGEPVAQAADGSRRVCRREDAITYINDIVIPRLRVQIAGSVMPTEMVRPKSYSYHGFTLQGYLELASLADKVGINLWDIGADSGNSMLVRPRARPRHLAARLVVQRLPLRGVASVLHDAVKCSGRCVCVQPVVACSVRGARCVHGLQVAGCIRLCPFERISFA